MKAFKTIVLIALVVAVLFIAGTCYFQNCAKKTLPDVPKCKYTVLIVATGNKYYTDKLTDLAGIVTLFNYYENVQGKYVYREITLELDRKLFGKIDIVIN